MLLRPGLQEAHTASLRVGAKRGEDIRCKYGVAAVLEAMNRIQAKGERLKKRRRTLIRR